MFKSKLLMDTHGGGFHTPPPSSRPPTKAYDRQSYVLVVDEDDEILKFCKMHLNRFFSHVVVAKSAADGILHLKQKEFDVIIADCAPAKKSNSDFLKKVATQWKHIPIILTDQDLLHNLKPEKFLFNVVIDIVKKPFDLDPFHIAIRRALNMRMALKEFASLLSSKVAIGEAVRKLDLAAFPENERELLKTIRKCLTEEIAE